MARLAKETTYSGENEYHYNQFRNQDSMPESTEYTTKIKILRHPFYKTYISEY
jgi:hypothetical protein